jgi:TonB family protein
MFFLKTDTKNFSIFSAWACSIAIHFTILFFMRLERHESPSTPIALSWHKVTHPVFSYKTASLRKGSKKIAQTPLGIEELSRSFSHNSQSSPTHSNDDGTNNVGPPVPYLNQVREKIYKELKYPLSLRRRMITGIVHVSFELNSRGEVTSSSITQSSGHPELDQLALNAIQDSSPFGKLREDRYKKEFKLNLPIEFKSHF